MSILLIIVIKFFLNYNGSNCIETNAESQNCFIQLSCSPFKPSIAVSLVKYSTRSSLAPC
jgi:hypothetical protein